MSRKAKAAAIAERQSRVAEMLKARYPYREMAGVLGVSLGCIAKDVRAIFKAWSKCQFENVHEQALADLALLDDGIRALVPRILRGETDAIFCLVRVLERRSRILSYESLIKVQHLGDQSGPSVVQQIIDVAKLSDDELRLLNSVLAKSVRNLEAPRLLSDR